MKNSLKYVLFLSCYFSAIIGYTQVIEEINPPEYIRTIEFKGPTSDSFPMVKLSEGISLSFDDLNATETDYYYKIVHCNYDWTPSALLKSEYLNGYDNHRIIDYQNSYNTLKKYSHYRLQIPNENLSLKVSGNYVLQVFNAYDELLFSRKFIVYENAVSVGVEVKRSRDFEYIYSKQSVSFFIDTEGMNLTQPNKEIKVALLKNHLWNSSIKNVLPQYISGNKLLYKYDQETSFFGGNEHLNFDTKDIKATQGSIARVALTDLYEHQLYLDTPRSQKPYTYFPDINGDFVVRTVQGNETSIEADYSRVHFSLLNPSNPDIDAIYVVGKFNNFQLEPSNQMKFDTESNSFYASMLFKQGFYNYRYEAVDRFGEVIPNAISGSFHFTENQYHVLVYYRGFGSVYDRIIGIGNANSNLMEN